MSRRDHGDFLEFADAYREQMRRTAYLLSGDWDRASDITQEALIRLYVAWPRLDHDSGLHSCARKAVASAAIDFCRKRSNRGMPVADAQNVHGGADSTAAVAEWLVMIQALAQLPPQQRACVVLRYYEDLDVEDVAVALGCRPGTVRSQIARGLIALRAAYADAGGELVVGSDSGKETATW